MKITETKFSGVFVIELDIFEDKRGSFFESWHSEKYRKVNITDVFVQDNISISEKNVIRGLHSQKNMSQLVGIVHGRVMDVVVDGRKESPTFMEHISFDLDAENPKQVHIPPGFFHGFCVLSDFAVMNYKCSQYYNPSHEERILWNDPALKIDWPTQTPLMSEKDQGFHCL